MGNLANGPALELSIVLTNLVTLGIAVAVTIAIVGYRLYDIDVLINRTLVYGVMTGVIVLIYSLVVGAAGILFQSRGNWLLTLLATGLVANHLQPHRHSPYPGTGAVGGGGVVLAAAPDGADAAWAGGSGAGRSVPGSIHL